MGKAMDPIRVMLVEDHLAFRRALAYLLSDDPQIEVVADAGSVAEAREALLGGGGGLVEEEDEGGGGGIDVALLDLGLPDGDGAQLIGELRRASPGVRIVVLSATVWAGGAEGVWGADAVLDKVRSYSRIAEEVRRLAGR